MISHLDHLVLTVKNLDATVNFYILKTNPDKPVPSN